MGRTLRMTFKGGAVRKDLGGHCSFLKIKKRAGKEQTRLCRLEVDKQENRFLQRLL
jgi:hypothetical protein